jgi:hypothetical protein
MNYCNFCFFLFRKDHQPEKEASNNITTGIFIFLNKFLSAINFFSF